MTFSLSVSENGSKAIRNPKTAAISETSPARPMGMWLSTSAFALGLSIQARLIGVMMAPGPTALTRIPKVAASRAADLVSPSTACLLAA